MNAVLEPRRFRGAARLLSFGGGLLMLSGLHACANFGGDPGRSGLRDDFSYYEPFDNSGEVGPAYLVGPLPPARSDGVNHAVSVPDKVLPPDKSLPPTCLTCD